MAPPLVPAERRTLQATGARRAKEGTPTVGEFVRTLREENARRGALVALFDARAIAGERHLLSAWAHLARSRSRGGERLRDRSAEFVLYVAGDDQLPRALAKAGVAEGSDRFVLVAERPRSIPELLALFGLVEDPSVFPAAPTESTLARLGLTAAEWSGVPSTAWEGLVLERVAFVDLLSSGGASAPPSKRRG